MIFTQLANQLNSLQQLLIQLTDEQYTLRIRHLSGASIGGHARHIIELLQCAIKGNLQGSIDYVNRSRNLALETNRLQAIEQLELLQTQLQQPDKLVAFVTEESGTGSKIAVNTTYFREVVYNTEHSIHHLALIRVALIEQGLHLVNDSFGMAPSTIRYKQTVASESKQNVKA